MKLKIIERWEGLISLLWISIVFCLIAYLVTHVLYFKTWRGWIIVIVVWWGVGLVFAISGLRHGHLASRVCAALTIGICLYFLYAFFFPRAY
jgi:hypothetical protein